MKVSQYHPNGEPILTATVVRENIKGIGDVIAITPHVVGNELIAAAEFILEAGEENELLAKRLVAAIEAGVAMTNVGITLMVGGDGYITAKDEFSHRRLEADLVRLGF